mgnify:CR=1 FL=1|jgi:toxin ParE1/3/4
MSRRLYYTHAARTDLLGIAHYIATQSTSTTLALQYVDGLRAQCRQLAALPGMLGIARPELSSDLRSLPYRSHVIFFRYEATAVQIVNILHARRDILHYFDTE